MLKLLQTSLDLSRCPHCSVSMPNLVYRWELVLVDFRGLRKHWRIYGCNRCAGLVAAWATEPNAEVIEMYPRIDQELSDDVPVKARTFLEQAVESKSAPAGAVMLAASAVDAMLKAKKLTNGTLFSRIDQAAAEHLITADMAVWAHEVRLDANDQRHADEEAPIP